MSDIHCSTYHTVLQVFFHFQEFRKKIGQESEDKVELL